jgi:hypothetical protein
MVRWVFSLLLPSLLWACTTSEKSALPVSHEYGGTALAIQFDKTLHFSAPDGAPVLATPDEYLVEQTADAQLRLVPGKGGSPLIVAAETGTHDLEVSTPFPLVLALNDDARDVVLLMPDGTALDAAGSLSGVRTRDIVRPRRHYQLAYQLNPATGQVQFGDGAIGQRLPAGRSSMSSNYRIGAGALGNVGTPPSSGAELSMIQLQSVVSDRTKAEALASNILAAQNEHFHLEYNTDRPGSDYGQRATVNPEACRAICSADGNCQAFTFVKPPSEVSTGQCYLKRTVPTPVGDRCCISAKRKSLQEEMIGNVGK